MLVAIACVWGVRIGDCQFARCVIQDEGYQVSTASNGREGLTHLEKLKPDLVLSDVMLPILDGRALCRAMQADPTYQAIPIMAHPGFQGGERNEAKIGSSAR